MLPIELSRLGFSPPVLFLQDLDVLLGEHDLTTAFDYTFRMPVSRIIEHPLYNPLVVNNDYSILVLREEVR